MSWIEQQAKGIFQDWDTNGLNHPNVQFLNKWVTKKGKELDILDIGCGNGEVTDMLTKQGHKVIGLDLPEVVVKIDKKGIYYGLDLNRDHFYPVENKKFDIIYAAAVIEHLYNDSIMLSNILDRLKDNGVAIITIPTKINISSNHCRYYPIVEWTRLINAYGFEILESMDHFGPSMKDHLAKEGELWCDRCLSRNMWALRRRKNEIPS